MTRREALFSGLSLLACAPVALSGCSGSGEASSSASSSSRGSGTLRVGVRDNIVGFGQYNSTTGKYYGVEIDIAEQMATRMGYASCEYVTVTPDTRKQMLQEGQVDCIVACYSASEHREENFDFSPAYYTDAIVLMVEKSSLISSVEDLNGGTIGTRAGANTAAYVATNLAERGFSSGEVLSANEDNTDVTFDTWHLLEYETYDELSDALERGEIDALAADGAIANSYMDDRRQTLADYKAASQDYAVATQKGSELSAKVSEAIQAMLDDGTISDLIDKWN